nr:hypothetical transcript [Hymenolepis microstoma]
MNESQLVNPENHSFIKVSRWFEVEPFALNLNVRLQFEINVRSNSFGGFKFKSRIIQFFPTEPITIVTADY